MSTCKIHFLSENKTDNSKYIHFPLKLYRQAILNQTGIDMRIVTGGFDAKGLYECDQLWVNSKVLRSFWGNAKQPAESILQAMQQKVKRLVYVDTTDSSGTLQAGALPYVHKYFKSYLLKDTRLYMTSFYGGRIYTDYYHQHLDIKDGDSIPPAVNTPVKDISLLNKLELFWNPLPGYKRWLLCPDLHAFFCTRPSSKKIHDISCRIGTRYTRKTIAFQRKKTQALLEQKGIPTQKISFRAFKKELRHSFASISPFGYGEFAYRDFDSIRSGCLLLKPSMEHLRTWPDIYQPMKTYIPLHWDFSDFISVIDRIKTSRNEFLSVAEQGYEYLMHVQNTRSCQNDFICFFKHLQASVKNAGV